MTAPQTYSDVTAALNVDSSLLPQGYFDAAMAAATPSSLAAKAQAFGDAMQALEAMQIDATAHPDLYASQQQLLTWGNDIAPVVQWATEVFNDVATWFSNTSSTVADWAEAGATGVSNVYNSAVNAFSDEFTSLFGPASPSAPGMGGLGGLGMLQLIPVAIIAGCVAMLAYWLDQYATFQKSAQVYSQALAAGATPAQAAQAAATVANAGGVGAAVKNAATALTAPILIAGVVGLGIVFAPQIKAALNARNARRAAAHG